MDCPRAKSWFRRCRFHGRYDSTAGGNVTPEQIDAVGNVTMFSSDAVVAIQALAGTSQKYVRDVCTRCGRSIERAEQK